MLVGEEIEPEAQDANAVDGEPQGYQERSVDDVVREIVLLRKTIQHN